MVINKIPLRYGYLERLTTKKQVTKALLGVLWHPREHGDTGPYSVWRLYARAMSKRPRP